MLKSQVDARVRNLGCWRGPVEPEPVDGGITNVNFSVVDAGRKFFVRIGEDIPVHQIMRFNELAASRAAHAAGVSPAVHFAEKGVLVLEFIEGRTLTPADVRDEHRLPRIVDLVKRFHVEAPRHWRGPALVFWVFQVIRDYAATLVEGASRLLPEVPRYVEIAGELERAVGPVQLVPAHNDLLAANFIDDGQRLWLIDYDYAGFNSPLFDLGGLASNNELSAAEEQLTLERYFEQPVSDALRRQYQAMKCASLLREAMWSMVSELHSTLDVDYVAYTTDNLERFERSFQAFKACTG